MEELVKRGYAKQGQIQYGEDRPSMRPYLTAPNKLMAVDDDSDITFTLKRNFEQRGFSIDVYNDPIEALANFKLNYYDLLLLDVKMPKMNGFIFVSIICLYGLHTTIHVLTIRTPYLVFVFPGIIDR